MVLYPKGRGQGEDGYKVFSIRIKEERAERISGVARETGYNRNELIGIFLSYALDKCAFQKNVWVRFRPERPPHRNALCPVPDYVPATSRFLLHSGKRLSALSERISSRRVPAAGKIWERMILSSPLKSERT